MGGSSGGKGYLMPSDEVRFCSEEQGLTPCRKVPQIQCLLDSTAVMDPELCVEKEDLRKATLFVG